MVEIYYAKTDEIKSSDDKSVSLCQSEEGFWHLYKSSRGEKLEYLGNWPNVGGSKCFTSEKIQSLIKDIDYYLENIDRVLKNYPPPETIGQHDLGHIVAFEEIQEYGKEGLKRFLLKLKNLCEEAQEKDMNVYFEGD